MNESFEEFNYSELKAELQALRKKVEDLEAMQKNHKTASARRWFYAGRVPKLLLLAGFLVLVVGLLAAAGDSNSLFIDPKGYVGISQANPEATLDVNGNALVRGQMGIGASKAEAPLDVNGNAVIRGQLGVGTATPQSIAEIRKDAGGALGPVLSIANFGGGGNAATALDFRSYNHPTPEARMQATDNNNYSDDIVFQNKVPGAQNNNLRTNLTIGSDGTVTIPGNLTVGGKADLGIYMKTESPNTSGYWDIACKSGDVAISGGAYVQGSRALRESRPLSANVWRVACVQGAGLVGLQYTQCEQAFVVCATHVK